MADTGYVMNPFTPPIKAEKERRYMCRECHHPTNVHGPDGCKSISWRSGCTCSCGFDCKEEKKHG